MTDQAADEPTSRDGGVDGERAATVEALRGEIRELRASLANEIRTRSLVIEDGDGFERFVVASKHRFGDATLYGRSEHDDVTCVDLFANDPVDGSGPHVGVALTDNGVVVAGFEISSGEAPRIWFTGQDGQPRGWSPEQPGGQPSGE
jgi:hypothetical protein